jgi:hypothetical protein
MPIRVEHGPYLAPIGQLAYRTGQLEYRNKRRTELERLAMQQAEMRQRAQMQQQQIASSLQGQQMSQMGAMQRLAMGQQFGQINAQQAQQWQVQADIQDQQNKMIWGKRLGQNQLDLANLQAGLADQKTIKNIQWEHKWNDVKNNLNQNGEAAYLENQTNRIKALNNPKNPPGSEAEINAQFDAQEQQITSDPNNIVGKENKKGWTESYRVAPNGDVESDKVLVSHDPNSGQAIYQYPIRTYNEVEINNPDGSVTIQRVPRTQEEMDAIQYRDIVVNGRTYIGSWNSDTGRYDADVNKPVETEKEKAQDRYNDALERHDDNVHRWEANQPKHSANYLAAKQQYLDHGDDPAPFPTFEVWSVLNNVPPRPTPPVEPDWAGFQNVEDVISLGDKPRPGAIGAPSAPGALGAPGAPGAPGMAGDPNAPPPFMEPEFRLQSESDFADLKPQMPQEPQEPPSEEFKAVPPKYHPRKQYSRTYKYDAPEKYDMMNMPMNAIDPADRQAVYEQRQRISRVLPWDSATHGTIGPRSIINIIRQPNSYGLKIDLTKDTSAAGKLMAEAWQEQTGSTVIKVNEDLMWRLLSPGLSEEESNQLIDRIYTEKKQHFEFYGEAEHFQNNRMQDFMQRVTSPGVR